MRLVVYDHGILTARLVMERSAHQKFLMPPSMAAFCHPRPCRASAIPAAAS
jgi:hypothetical protein